ncbi:MAG: DUF6544 family protein [Armatimonadota bacterium]
MRTIGKVALAVAGVTGAAVAVLAHGSRQDERRVNLRWQALERAASELTPPTPMSADLPEPARRYFAHAIAPDAVPCTSVLLDIVGKIKGERELAVSSRELLVPGLGFIWKTQARMGPFKLSGADFYLQDEGETKFRIFGLLPVVSMTGPKVARSSRGRLVAESMWCPAGLVPDRGVAWQAVDTDRAKALIMVDEETLPLTINVGPHGELIDFMVPRYNADPDNGPIGELPFGGVVEAEGTFQGYTIPTVLRAGWNFGTAEYRETFEFTVVNAAFR